jgi:hypothetical protein
VWEGEERGRGGEEEEEEEEEMFSEYLDGSDH